MKTLQEEQNRGKPNWEHLEDELHVLVQCEDTSNRVYIKLKSAVDQIKKLLVPAVITSIYYQRTIAFHHWSIDRLIFLPLPLVQYASGFASRQLLALFCECTDGSFCSSFDFAQQFGEISFKSTSSNDNYPVKITGIKCDCKGVRYFPLIITNVEISWKMFTAWRDRWAKA